MVTKQKSQEVNKNTSAADRLEIQYFTDPLCCWSWAFESAWQRLQEDYSCNITYRMGGLLSDWKNYHDHINAVSKPLQMGPVWMQARQVSGTIINDRIWFTDPPASSYPACVAIKAAGRQSAEVEKQYLFLLREAVMVKEKNIARKPVLLQIAKVLSDKVPGLLDYDQFERDLSDPHVINAFKADLQEVSYRNINRFPTLLVRSARQKGALIITGNRPYEAITMLLDKFISGS